MHQGAHQKAQFQNLWLEKKNLFQYQASGRFFTHQASDQKLTNQKTGKQRAINQQFKETCPPWN